MHSDITITFRGRESIKTRIDANKMTGGPVNVNTRT